MISWINRKKTNFSITTVEDDYIASCSTCSEVIWLRKILIGLFDSDIYAIDIYCDNQSCIKLTENPMFHDKSKNIEIKYHYIWDMVHRGLVKLQYAPTEEHYC